MKGKIDTINIVKKSSRDFFAGVDTRTRRVASKKVYKRKQKHASRVDG